MTTVGDGSRGYVPVARATPNEPFVMDDFQIMDDPHTKTQTFVRALGFGTFAAGVFNMSNVFFNRMTFKRSLPPTLGVFVTIFSLTWGVSSWVAQSRMEAMERLRKQDIEGMHFMKFESLAPSLPVSANEDEIEMSVIKKLIKETDAQDSQMLKKSYTATPHSTK